MSFIRNKRGSATELILQPTILMILVLGIILSIMLYTVHTIPEKSDVRKKYLATTLELTTEALGILAPTEHAELFIPTQWLGTYAVDVGASHIAVQTKTEPALVKNTVLPAELHLVPKKMSADPKTQGYRLEKQGSQLTIESDASVRAFNPTLLACPSQAPPKIVTLGIDAALGYDAKSLSFSGSQGRIVSGLQESHATRVLAKALLDAIANKGLFGIEPTRELRNQPYGRGFLPEDSQLPQKISERAQALKNQDLVLSIGIGSRENQILAYVKYNDAGSVATACMILNAVSNSILTPAGNPLITGMAVVPVDLSQYSVDAVATPTVDEADALQILQAGKTAVVLEIGTLGDALTQDPEHMSRVSLGIAKGLAQVRGVV